jgi:hypothetical protein
VGAKYGKEAKTVVRALLMHTGRFEQSLKVGGSCLVLCASAVHQLHTVGCWSRMQRLHRCSIHCSILCLTCKTAIQDVLQTIQPKHKLWLYVNPVLPPGGLQRGRHAC